MTPDQIRWVIGFARAIAFIMGASFSLMVGQLGMRMAVEGNVRVAAESRKSFAGALRMRERTPAERAALYRRCVRCRLCARMVSVPTVATMRRPSMAA